MTEPLHTGLARKLLPYLLAAGMIIPAGLLQAQNPTIVVRPGSTVNVTGGFVPLKDVDLRCDGQWQSSGGVTQFTGVKPASIGGSGTIKLWTVEMAKSPAVALTLHSGMQIVNSLQFNGGLLDLNGQQLQLADTARVLGESDQSRIIGLEGGKVVASVAGVNAPHQLNVGNLGAVLTSPANIGTLTVNRSPMPATGSGIGIQRTYLIQPQNNTALEATLRLYYLDAELNGDDPRGLNLWKSIDGIAWTLVGADTRDTANHFVEKTGIADLSYWTLSDLTSPLPLKLISFSAVCAGDNALIEWKTGEESQLNDFQVQRSVNGTSWLTLGSVTAVNAANGASYSFTDATPQPSCFYRLMIVDQDGKDTYSPVFSGGCSDIALPFRVYPNPVVSQAVAQISLRQAGKGKVQVLSMSGAAVYEAEWNLQAGVSQLVIPVSGWAAGSYFLRLLLPDGIQTTQFIKL